MIVIKKKVQEARVDGVNTADTSLEAKKLALTDLKRSFSDLSYEEKNGKIYVNFDHIWFEMVGPEKSHLDYLRS